MGLDVVYTQVARRWFGDQVVPFGVLLLAGVGLLLLAGRLEGGVRPLLRRVFRWPGGTVFFRIVPVGLAGFLGVQLLLSAALADEVWLRGPEAFAAWTSHPWLYAGFALLGSTVEEALFRGLGVVWVASVWPGAAGAAIAVSSVLFGLGHGIAPEPVLLYGTLGAVLAIIARVSDSVVPSLVIHLLMNGVLWGGVLFG